MLRSLVGSEMCIRDRLLLLKLNEKFNIKLFCNKFYPFFDDLSAETGRYIGIPVYFGLHTMEYRKKRYSHLTIFFAVNLRLRNLAFNLQSLIPSIYS